MRRLGTRQQQTVVVDLGRTSIKMALAESAGEAVRFHGITRMPLPHLEGDAVQETTTLVHALRRAVERRGWTGMPAACLLSGTATSTQSFLLPPMPQADLRRAIALRLKDRLHFDLSEASFDFRRVHEHESGEGSPMLTLVAAAQIDSIRQGVRVLRESGLRPTAIGSASESLANLSQCTSLWSSAEASIHVDMRSESTILNLFEGNLLRFSREIDTGGNAFTSALMRPILTPEGAVQLTLEQAEEIKRVAGYPRETEDVTLPYGVRSSAILPLMEPVAQRISVEIERSITYLCGLLERSSIDRIALSGPAGRMRNLDRFLQENLGTPVEFNDPVARAKSHWRLAISGDHPADLASFSAILGFSIGQRQPINLLPEEERLERVIEGVTRVRRAVVPPVAAAGICLALMGLPINRNYSYADAALRWSAEQLDTRLHEQTERLIKRERTDDAVAELEVARGLVPDWIGVSKELAALLPAAAHLTELDMTVVKGRPVLDLSASVEEAHSPFHVISTRLTKSLADSPFFADVHVVEAALGKDGAAGRYRATMHLVAPYRQPRAGER